MQLNNQAAIRLLRQPLEAQSETASQDAQVLLSHVLDKPRAWVLTHSDERLNAEQIKHLQRVTRRLESGEPLPYILGHWEFYGLNFSVSPAVLIPRPETEILVEYALSWLADHPARRRAVDVGTGSGCIAVTLASLVPELRVLAVDISWPALRIARQNITRHQLAGRIPLAQLDLLAGLHPPPHHRFDMICANLPYIPQRTLETLDQLRWEPRTALSGGRSGSEPIQRMLRDLPQVIAPGGLLLLEIEASLGAAIHNRVREVLPGADVQVLPDLAGQDRLVVAQT